MADEVFVYRIPPETKIAVELICERKRQINEESWTLAADDEQTGGQLALAAAAHATHAAALEDENKFLMGDAKWSWPWRALEYKPKDQRRDLVRAAALLIAEIERIDRRAAKAQKAEAGA